jgi:hypothetical protein
MGSLDTVFHLLDQMVEEEIILGVLKFYVCNEVLNGLN